MTDTRDRQVFYADGDTAGSPAVRSAIRRAGLKVTCFRCTGTCLRSLESQPCDLLISNARRPAEEGMDLLVRARRLVLGLPIVLLVDQGDIRTAVRAMKAGAVDCLERPLATARLTAALDSALRTGRVGRGTLPNPLSPVEERVLRLVCQGRTSRDIAGVLHRSQRTIEVHRHHVMWKLGVGSIVELVKKAASMGWFEM